MFNAILGMFYACLTVTILDCDLIKVCMDPNYSADPGSALTWVGLITCEHYLHRNLSQVFYGFSEIIINVQAIRHSCQWILAAAAVKRFHGFLKTEMTATHITKGVTEMLGWGNLSFWKNSSFSDLVSESYNSRLKMKWCNSKHHSSAYWLRTSSGITNKRIAVSLQDDNNDYEACGLG